MAVIDRDRWRVLEPLLDRALDLSTEEQATWLEELRVSSPELAAELSLLLSGEASADRRGFLAESLDVGLKAPLEGGQLGAYTLERPLGQGGMGSVWLARRTDGRFEGLAAVKLLNLALLSATGQERFRREGSTLARLAHPGIARLLDAGVAASGQPYLVLEYIEGRRIDTYADEHRLTPAERMRLVIQVLSAVGHAHANLVVHRDLKPSNILVTGDGTAKLLDFGIAKLLAAEGDEERSALTADGGRALTPECAAPEQVRGGPITTATDIYAVGLLLYTLLTGRRPYELTGRSAAEIERIVCEVDPPKPSSALEDYSRGENERSARARARGGTPDRVRRQLRGDLDAIVMRALHKEPERRYPSAAALTDDLERLLHGHPVGARPDRVGYRMRKFVGRHRSGVTIAMAVVTLLAGAALRERTLRARAEAEAHKAGAVEQYLVSVFDVADPYAPPDRRSADITARALLDRGAARLDSVLAGQPDVQAELRGVLGHVYVNLGLYDKAAPLLQRSLEQQRSLYGPRHPAVARAMDQLGEVLAKQNHFDRAEPLLREALAQRRALLGNRDSAVAESVDHLATLLQERSDYDAAEPLFREALAIRRALHGPDHQELANSLQNLGLLFFRKGAFDEAEPLYRQALAIKERRLGEDHPLTAETLHNLGQVQQLRGQLDEAEMFFRRALAAKRKTLGNAHPSVTVNLNNLGNLLARERGQLKEGEALIREALALDRQMFGEHHTYVAAGLNNLASVLRRKGDFDGAAQTFRQALAVNRSLYQTEHIAIAVNLNNIAAVLQLKGDLDGAIPLFRQSLAQYGRLVGEKHPYHTTVSINLAKALREHGQAVEAESLFRGAASRLDTANRAHRPQLIASQVGLGQALTDQGRAREALPVLERALELSQEQYGGDNWRTGEVRLALGTCLAASGDHARAEPVLLAAYAALQKERLAQPRLALQAGAALAHLYQALGRPDEARRYRVTRRRSGER